jgi:hypothetical protein
MTQAVIALNGRGKTVGIRDLFWVECRRFVELFPDELPGLERLHDEPGRYAAVLADRVRKKAAQLRARDPWRTSIDPKLLREQWLDLNLSGPAAGALSDDEVSRIADDELARVGR